jgi:hypothetical protein
MEEERGGQLPLSAVCLYVCLSLICLSVGQTDRQMTDRRMGICPSVQWRRGLEGQADGRMDGRTDGRSARGMHRRPD